MLVIGGLFVWPNKATQKPDRSAVEERGYRRATDIV